MPRSLDEAAGRSNPNPAVRRAKISEKQPLLIGMWHKITTFATVKAKQP